MPQHLFVYGTLRSEFPGPLAVKLRTKAKLVGKGSTPGALYDFGWYPGAAFTADARTRVVGEVYALGNAERLIAQLDNYEGAAEPNQRFHRVVVTVRLEKGGTVEAWSYEMVELPANRRPVESGDFILHLQRRGGWPTRL
ncbi:MAG TPA: gamma-glutamylcyclotransferase family protein [Methyloceanibacter sp.]|nr:gamma-glutamylcyclotransferase family protein [Methyloceanibacter sp.]